MLPRPRDLLPARRTHALQHYSRKGLQAWAEAYLRRQLPKTTQLTRGQDGLHRHACLTWPAEDRRIFWYRADAARKQLHLATAARETDGLPTSECAGRGHSARGGSSGVRADLAELAPFVLERLTSGQDPDYELVDADDGGSRRCDAGHESRRPLG